MSRVTSAAMLSATAFRFALMFAKCGTSPSSSPSSILASRFLRKKRIRPSSFALKLAESGTPDAACGCAPAGPTNTGGLAAANSCLYRLRVLDVIGADIGRLRIVLACI
eukprot:3411056-Rhodomonas_salina.2